MLATVKPEHPVNDPLLLNMNRRIHLAPIGANTLEPSNIFVLHGLSKISCDILPTNNILVFVLAEGRTYRKLYSSRTSTHLQAGFFLPDHTRELADLHLLSNFVSIPSYAVPLGPAVGLVGDT